MADVMTAPPMAARMKTVALTVLALLAFAANSVLCRLALRDDAIDPASFTAIRIVSGALVLWLAARMQNRGGANGSWMSALALFAYAITFSLAYIELSVATGALLLFGVVQFTMIGAGLARGERLAGWKLIGFIVAVAGLLGLLLPGASAPSVRGALLMIVAGASWGLYSLRAKGEGDPIRVTAGNFLRAAPMALLPALVLLPQAKLGTEGVLYAIASGALASGAGYAVWYAALRGLQATTAATVQLSVPLIAACAGMLLAGEAIGLRFVLASAAILGGIALVLLAGMKRTEGGRSR